MTLTINSNIAALRAQRRLGESTEQLTRSFERLSSGQRINRASDDAAGIAVADTLRSKSRLFTTASRNINDGLSALNIMSDSLSLQVGVLQRLKELAEQAANGTFSTSQRQSLEQEYRTLTKELGRIGDTTQFNNLSLLLGGRGSNPDSLSLQAGVTGSRDSLLRIDTVDSGSYSGSFEIGGGGLVSNYEVTSEELAADFGNRLLSASVVDSSGVSRDLLIGFEYGAGAGGTSFYTAWIFQRTSDTGGEGASTQLGDTVGAGTEWIAGANSAVMLDDGTGRRLSGLTNVGLSFEDDTIAATLSLDLTGLLFTGIPEFSVPTPQGTTTAIEGSGIESVSRALDSLTVIDARMNELLSVQGQLGALQSRLGTALSLGDATRENYLAAESRIRDVDIASESSKLVASQILQQTASAILAQASEAPGLALRLLGIDS